MYVQLFKIRLYNNFLYFFFKVHATDKDVSEEFGKVCEYTIETKDVPFSIDKLTGVISLDKPLDDKAPHYCTFQVSAKDCSSKTSLYANVTIYIKDPCKIGEKEIGCCWKTYYVSLGLVLIEFLMVCYMYVCVHVWLLAC